MDEAIRLLQDRGIEVVGCAANVGKKEDLQRLVKLAMDTYGTVDVLVSNAAVNPAAGLILDMPDSAIEKILDVNVKSAILLTKEARPHMSKVSSHLGPSLVHCSLSPPCLLILTCGLSIVSRKRLDKKASPEMKFNRGCLQRLGSPWFTPYHTLAWL